MWIVSFRAEVNSQSLERRIKVDKTYFGVLRGFKRVEPGVKHVILKSQPGKVKLSYLRSYNIEHYQTVNVSIRESGAQECLIVRTL